MMLDDMSEADLRREIERIRKALREGEATYKDAIRLETAEKLLNHIRKIKSSV